MSLPPTPANVDRADLAEALEDRLLGFVRFTVFSADGEVERTNWAPLLPLGENDSVEAIGAEPSPWRLSYRDARSGSLQGIRAPDFSLN